MQAQRWIGLVTTPVKSMAPEGSSTIVQKNGWSTIISNSGVLLVLLRQVNVMSFCRQAGQRPNRRISTNCRARRVCGKVGTGVFFKVAALQQQKGIGQAHQGDMVMPALPAAALVVVQPQFLLELLVVLFYPPAQLGQPHQTAPGHPLGQIGEPIFGRGCRICGPFNQYPDRGQLGLVVSLAMSRLGPTGAKAAALWTLRALAPGNSAPRLRRQCCSQLAQGQRLSA